MEYKPHAKRSWAPFNHYSAWNKLYEVKKKKKLEPVCHVFTYDVYVLLLWQVKSEPNKALIMYFADSNIDRQDL